MQVLVSTQMLDHASPISWEDNADEAVTDEDGDIDDADQNGDVEEDHLKPAEEESKLDCEKEWVEQVQLCLCVSHWEAVRLLNKISLQL